MLLMKRIDDDITSLEEKNAKSNEPKLNNSFEKRDLDILKSTTSSKEKPGSSIFLPVFTQKYHLFCLNFIYYQSDDIHDVSKEKSKFQKSNLSNPERPRDKFGGTGKIPFDITSIGYDEYLKR